MLEGIYYFGLQNLLYHKANGPIGEYIITPWIALTMVEYYAYECRNYVLEILINTCSYVLWEVSLFILCKVILHYMYDIIDLKLHDVTC